MFDIAAIIAASRGHALDICEEAYAVIFANELAASCFVLEFQEAFSLKFLGEFLGNRWTHRFGGPSIQEEPEADAAERDRDEQKDVEVGLAMILGGFATHEILVYRSQRRWQYGLRARCNCCKRRMHLCPALLVKNLCLEQHQLAFGGAMLPKDGPGKIDATFVIRAQNTDMKPVRVDVTQLGDIDPRGCFSERRGRLGRRFRAALGGVHFNRANAPFVRFE